MANPFIGVRIPPELEKAIIARMAETGQSKSDIVIGALKAHLGMMSCHERLNQVEQRLSALETIAKEANKLLSSCSPKHHTINAPTPTVERHLDAEI